MRTTLSCNLYGAAAADPGPSPAGPAHPGGAEAAAPRPRDDLAGFGHIPWTGWWVGRGGALLKITLAGEEPGTRENCILSVPMCQQHKRKLK